MSIAPVIPLEQARSFLRITGNALDDEIALMVAAAIADLERVTSTRLIRQPVTFRAASFADLAAVPVGPIVSVTEIRVDGVVIDAARYRLTGIGLARGIVPADGESISGTNVVVTAIAGYADAPADVPANLRWAVLALLRGKFEDRPVDIDPLIVNDRIWL